MNKTAGGRPRSKWDRFGRKEEGGMKLRWRRGSGNT
jgi:hypothetical protein